MAAPVTGQGFQNTKLWPAVLSFQKIAQIEKNPAKPNYHMPINKSQVILKYLISYWLRAASLFLQEKRETARSLIDLKNSVWFTLGSENETKFCDSPPSPSVKTFFQLDSRSRFSNSKWLAVLYSR